MLRLLIYGENKRILIYIFVQLLQWNGIVNGINRDLTWAFMIYWISYMGLLEMTKEEAFLCRVLYYYQKTHAVNPMNPERKNVGLCL